MRILVWNIFTLLFWLHVVIHKALLLRNDYVVALTCLIGAKRLVADEARIAFQYAKWGIRLIGVFYVQ